MHKLLIGVVACLPSIGLACRRADNADQPSAQIPAQVSATPPDTAPLEASPDSSPAHWCVPRAIARLAGVATYTPNDSLETILGAPVRSASGGGEDDGGAYRTTILYFAHVVVEIDDRGYGIERVETLDSTVPFLQGIRLGVPLAEVQDRLSAPGPIRTLETRRDREVWIAPVCDDGPHRFPSETEAMYFYVNSTQHVTGVAVTDYGP